MKYHICPVCGKNGLYLPALRRWTIFSVPIQYSPRCKYCNHWLPVTVNGERCWVVMEKDTPEIWKRFNLAQKEDFIYT